MNKRWLARAALFEAPTVKRCKRGHNMERAGIYISQSTTKGKKYTATKCAQCAIENVQRCRVRKRQAERLAA